MAENSDEENQQESTDDPEPIKEAPLKKLVKNKQDFRAGSSGVEELFGDLEYLAQLIWARACEYAEEDNLSTVREEHIKKAYDDLLEPHDILLEASNDLTDLRKKMDDYRDQSPIESSW